MEAFGRVLALEPYLTSVVLSGTALRLAGNAALQSELLPQIAQGKLTVAFAYGERQARYDLSDVLTTAKRKTRLIRYRSHGFIRSTRRFQAPQTCSSQNWLYPAECSQIR